MKYKPIFLAFGLKEATSASLYGAAAKGTSEAASLSRMDPSLPEVPKELWMSIEYSRGTLTPLSSTGENASFGSCCSGHSRLRTTSDNSTAANNRVKIENLIASA